MVENDKRGMKRIRKRSFYRYVNFYYVENEYRGEKRACFECLIRLPLYAPCTTAFTRRRTELLQQNYIK